MTENESDLRLNGLPLQVQDSLSVFYEKLRLALHDNLQSITVVGSSLTEDFRPGQSDINTVLVLGRQTLASLKAVAALARPMRKKHLSAPLLMTASYIERSRDVFGVEFLDFQLTHQTVLGDDPFKSITVEKKDVRLQCERELKAMLIRLRQGYVAAAANTRLVRDILISTAKGLLPLLRAMLWLKGEDRPRTSQATLNRAAKLFSVGTDSLVNAASWRGQKVRLNEDELHTTFESAYTAIDQMAAIVDEMEL